MPTNPTAEQVGEYAKNAFYVGVGLGVLAAQQLQVQRRQLAHWVTGQATEARTSVDGLQDKLQDRVKLAEERLTALEEQAEMLLSELKDRLPEPVRDLAEQSIDYATSARAELFELFGSRVPGTLRSARSRSTKAA
jgi:hypothetical protein